MLSSRHLRHPHAVPKLHPERADRETRRPTRAAEASQVQEVQDELPLVPFVLESHGGWGKAAQDFLHQLSLEAAEGDEEQALAYYVRSMRACSFAVQRGNAHVMGTGVMQTRARRV